MTAVGAGGCPAAARVGTFLARVAAGVVINRAVAQLGDGGLSGAVGRERFAGLPGLAAVIAVDGVGVVLRPFAAVVLTGIPAGGADESALVFAVAQVMPCSFMCIDGSLPFESGLMLVSILFQVLPSSLLT